MSAVPDIDPKVRAIGRAAEAQAEAELDLSEDALAQRFTARHTDDLRYCASWGRWYEWRAARWVADDTLHAFDLAREICREEAEQTSKPARRAAIASARTVAGVVRLAQADRVHAAVPEQFDADPYLLNTPAGAVDLRDGALREHDRADYCTKMTAVGPGGPRRRWGELLKFVTGGDEAYIAHLQRWFGYCLTADVREEKLVFGYGEGGNGKGTTVNTIAGVMGDYARVAPMETFTYSRTDRHPTELAMLRGARLITAQETQQGRSWNEARIKALTGRDPISARFMRGDFFTFDPTFKLVLFGNHRPSLHHVDAAIRRRLLLLPFTEKVETPDPTLKDALRGEWGGILEWMIEGCLAWRRDGLAPPARVLAATEAYLSSEDTFQTWIEERCEDCPAEERHELHRVLWWSSSRELYESWHRFEGEAGITAPLSQKAFARALEERGYPRATGGARGKERGFLWIRPANMSTPGGRRVA